MIDLAENQETGETAEMFPKAPRKPEVRLGKGRMVTVALVSRGDATAVAAALQKPGVIEVLSVLGRIESLAPSERKLAQTLIGE